MAQELMDRQTAPAPPASEGPRPAAAPAPIPLPEDIPYPGRLVLEIDATDTVRGILRARQTIPVEAAGRMTLLYPKWIPGYHSPQNPLELFAGLEIRAAGAVLAWRRDPVEVYAFHIDVPEDCAALEVSFQFLSPTAASQGDVVVTPDLSLIQWSRMVLYPAGHYTRRIEIAASLILPDGWSFATALEVDEAEGPRLRFTPVPLDVLVDNPVMAGRWRRELPLDEDGDVRMSLFSHDQAGLAATPEQIEPHRALVQQARRLFAARHYDRYRFLVALSDELGGGGVEHHRSAEIVAPPGYFTEWDRTFTKRDVMAHEFTHSWNGKFRRGQDSWTPSFERPIRNSLMWVYEGQTQYWGQVLTARSGLWSAQAAREALAKVAAVYDVRPGGLWRAMRDTTSDPVIAGRAPLPWPSWQRSEDYYSEGQLLWLAIDTLIRELTGDERSLDDFARLFFGMDDGSMQTRTYDFEEVVATLTQLADHDWAGLLTGELESREPGAPLEGLERGGYRLVYRDHRSGFCKSYDAVYNQFDLRFSIGLTIGSKGLIQEVMWSSAAFDAGLTAASTVTAVNGQDYSEIVIGDAIEAAASGGPLALTVDTRGRTRQVEVDYRGGHRFPHLEPLDGARRRLDEIYAAR